MSNPNFTTTLLVDASPAEAFHAINNPRGWWSEEIEGDTHHLGGEWTYHFQDVHRCTLKIVEFIPAKRVVWQVLANQFNFIKDQTEWVGTRIVFDISQKDMKTNIRFTHEGLVQEYECYDICHNAWTDYIQGSLRKLIETGTGTPNAREGAPGFTTTIKVDQTPEEAYDAINDVTGWWTGASGDSHEVGDEFIYRHKDLHYSKHKVAELVRGKRVVWLVTDSRLSFVPTVDEWTGTRVVFDISSRHGKTFVTFTHEGMVPAWECYEDCTHGWSYYVNDVLPGFIAAAVH